jgi:Kef-type K+ transport system membrane component KefB
MRSAFAMTESVHQTECVPQDVFTMLVIMAVATTIMTGPLVQILLRRAGHEETKPIEA